MILQAHARVSDAEAKVLVAAATYLGSQLEAVDTDIQVLLMASGANAEAVSEVRDSVCKYQSVI